MSDAGDDEGSAIDISIRNYKLGAAVGAGAYLVGYVLTYLLAVVDGATAEGVDTLWRGVGWLFYSAHNIVIEVDLEVLAGEGVSYTNALTNPERVGGVTGTIPEAVYLLVPIVILVAAGFLVYKIADEPDLSTRGSAGLGATVLFGYYALAIVGMFLFTLTFGPNAVGPWLGMSFVVLAVYPLIFGAIGGVIAHQTS